MTSPDALLPGFADAGAQSQRCFRAVLDAMAHPGRIVAVTGPTPPAPLHAATGAVLLTLLDADTPTWLDGACAPAESWLAFHCGALLVAPAQAGDRGDSGVTGHCTRRRHQLWCQRPRIGGAGRAACARLAGGFCHAMARQPRAVPPRRGHHFVRA